MNTDTGLIGGRALPWRAQCPKCGNSDLAKFCRARGPFAALYHHEVLECEICHYIAKASDFRTVAEFGTADPDWAAAGLS